MLFFGYMQKQMRLILTSFALILPTLLYLVSYRALAISGQNNTGQFTELIRQEIRNFFVNMTNPPQSPTFYKLLEHHNGGIISSPHTDRLDYAVSYVSNLKTLNSTIFFTLGRSKFDFSRTYNLWNVSFAI